jgi:hypothetical protein|tara:strand:- start:93 stop:473 length:381 start_codon:yes stop_codon:yes gene_type:complete
MFDRSRYIGATSQIESTGKFDFALPESAIQQMISILSDDDLYSEVNRVRKNTGSTWYEAIAAACVNIGQNEEAEIEKNMWATILACTMSHMPKVRAEYQGPQDLFMAACGMVGCDDNELKSAKSLR